MKPQSALNWLVPLTFVIAIIMSVAGLFTALATFVPSLYFVAFYVFGMIGGLLALTWFVLVALRLFKLGRTNALF